jgi:putative peptidoglycan lipid II flippase
MTVAALPLVDLVYRRGLFTFSDSQMTAVYFFLFSLSLAFWAAQGLYSRAFYAAGNTLTPMVASTLITIASIPVYSALFHAFSSAGLAIASNVGIAANTLVMAVLLYQRKLVTTTDLPWKELGKVAIAAVASGVLSYYAGGRIVLRGSRAADFYALALISVTWLGTVALVLWLTRSQLPGLLRRKP